LDQTKPKQLFNSADIGSVVGDIDYENVNRFQLDMLKDGLAQVSNIETVTASLAVVPTETPHGSHA
jgi:hypothetical protein